MSIHPNWANNGDRLPLKIVGVFEGVCGVSRGVLAFVPNRGDPKRAPAIGALDGKPVRLSDMKPSGDGVTWQANFEEMA